jgi:sialate O-acetylesterase
MTFKIIVRALILSVIVASTGKAQIKLPRLISNGMVLQRDHRVRIWGWASTSEEVVVNFNGAQYKTRCDSSRRWEIMLPAMRAGGPYTMSVKGRNEILIKDILVGDVWVCSGQSNMEFTMSRVKDKYASIIASSTNLNIRQFKVKSEWGFTAKDDTEASGWVAANPQTILQYTAVGYFFARSVFEKQQVPIGIINTSYGGSSAEAWLSEDAVLNFPQLNNQLSFYKDPANVDAVVKSDKKMIGDWFAEVNRKDEGLRTANTWASPATDTATWKNIKQPGYWEKKEPGNIDGVIWFRKEILVSAENAGQDAKLILGNIDDRDSTFVNGEFVGNTNDKYTSRSYTVPGRILKKGINTIVVRVIDTDGPGGFNPDKNYSFIIGNNTFSLSGTWKYKIGAVNNALPVAKITKFYLLPTSLYHTMINPLLRYTIKGFVWYQGEANTQKPQEYQALLTGIIQTWRAKWDEGKLPFIYVQLPFLGNPDLQPSSSTWATIREAQTNVLTLPRTGMAITLDLGEAGDIHPSAKKEVGERVALVAEHLVYKNRSVVYSGPLFKAIKTSGNKLIISFKNTGSGLIAKNSDVLHGFAIAGKDNKYVWANAKIEKDKVIVWNDSLLDPVSVRYAWANNPGDANLFNKEGLPASSFRTDK